MGIDIHAYVECDFQNSAPPFTSPESVRCINTGEFFVWRDLELFHALGLDYYESERPESPLVLGSLPDCLSLNLIKKVALVLTPSVEVKTAAMPVRKFPAFAMNDWQDQHLQYFPIINHEFYGIDLLPGETLLCDPGCELPNSASDSELKNAISVCGVDGNKVDYFLAIIAMMEKLAQKLSTNHVRLVYWFDSLPVEFRRDYYSRHDIPVDWPGTSNPG